MIHKHIYMDNAASTKVSDNVKTKLIDSLEIYGNPSSIHEQGELANNLIQESTSIISKKINCKPSEIHYTSGATMSNNLLIQGFMNKYLNAKLVISAIEHNDIMMLGKKYNAYIVPVDNSGFLDAVYLNNLLNELGKYPILCSIQMANGECGVIQNIELISNIVHKYPDAYFHTDATQFLPYYPIDVEELNIDALSMSGQKINCIKGTGILYKKKSLEIEPIILGEQGLIGGTENVPGIACLGAAFDSLDYDVKCLESMRDYFISKVNSKNIIGDLKHRLPNNIYIKCNIDSESMVVFLNEFGICSSAGSACSFNDTNPSHVVRAMGYSEKEAKSCVRFTINKETTYDDIDYVVDIFNKLNNKGE